MAKAVISVARQSRRNRNTTSAASSHAFQQHVLGGARSWRGCPHGREDAGELHAGMGLLQLFEAILSTASSTRRRWRRGSSSPGSRPPGAVEPGEAAHLAGAVADLGTSVSARSGPRWGWSGRAARPPCSPRRARARSARARRPAPGRRGVDAERCAGVVDLGRGEADGGHAVGVDDDVDLAVRRRRRGPPGRRPLACRARVMVSSMNQDRSTSTCRRGHGVGQDRQGYRGRRADVGSSISRGSRARAWSILERTSSVLLQVLADLELDHGGRDALGHRRGGCVLTAEMPATASSTGRVIWVSISPAAAPLLGDGDRHRPGTRRSGTA
jgi:hypothetical protein